jgi:predicted phage terminase large subunit-like protein
MTDREDPRRKGQALWPAKFSQKKVEATKKRMESSEGNTGIRWWNALYQQTPSALEGMLFKSKYWKEYDETDPPEYIGFVHSWDTASDTKSINDWSVRGKFGIWLNGKGEAIGDLVDVWRERVEYPGLKAQAQKDVNTDNPIWLLIERKSSGIALIQDLMDGRTTLPIWREDEDKPYGVVPVKDKIGRAIPTVGVIAEGKIRIPKRAAWKAEFLKEMAQFPNAKNDDQVDMFTQFANWFRMNFQVPQQKVISGSRGGRRR